MALGLELGMASRLGGKSVTGKALGLELGMASMLGGKSVLGLVSQLEEV